MNDWPPPDEGPTYDLEQADPWDPTLNPAGTYVVARLVEAQAELCRVPVVQGPRLAPECYTGGEPVPVGGTVALGKLRFARSATRSSQKNSPRGIARGCRGGSYGVTRNILCYKRGEL